VRLRLRDQRARPAAALTAAWRVGLAAAGGVMVISAGSQRSAEAIASLGSSGSSNTSDVQEVVAEFQTLLASRLASGSAAAELGAEALTRRLVGHLSVTPALQLALYTKLPVSLHQPRYVICIGRSQVRVAMYAFVGAPVSGDRPDRKHTPFVLKILTPDLLEGEDMPGKDDEIGFEYTVGAASRNALPPPPPKTRQARRSSSAAFCPSTLALLPSRPPVCPPAR
jgi:hypothetical protein